MGQRRKGLVTYGLSPIDGNGSNETEDFSGSRRRQPARRNGLARPGAEWRMRRILVMVGMFTGTCRCRHSRIAHRNQTHQPEIDHRRDSGNGVSDSADASRIHV